MNRRSFLFYTIATAVTGSLSTELAFASPHDANDAVTIDLSKDLTSVGDSKKIKKAIVVRTAEGNEPGSFVALSGKCTHRGCKVSYNSAQNRFECPCHGSMYSIEGEVIHGPAKEALTKYTVSISNNTLTFDTDKG